MQRSPRRSIRVVTAALAGIVALVVGAPPVLGMASPGELGRVTALFDTMALSNIAPGDWFSDELEIHNEGVDLLDYNLVFVREGTLWHCDPGGNNPYYEVAWSPGADQRLEPGETEIATISVHFPLAAGNECQGHGGGLVIRQGFLPAAESGGVYECRELPILSDGTETSRDGDSLDGNICWDISGVLHPLLKN